MTDAAKAEKPTSGPNCLQITREESETRDGAIAKAAASPIVRGASTARKYIENLFGDVDLTAYVTRLVTETQTVVDGDLSPLERMLTVQAGTLDAVFNAVAVRAAHTKHAPTQESLLRMALKAQAQCAHTVKVLGELKAPRQVAFIKQQNNANGPQQVNNKATKSCSVKADARPSRARAGKKEQLHSKNELLEESDGKRLDARAPGKAGRVNKTLETVGSVDRATH